MKKELKKEKLSALNRQHLAQLNAPKNRALHESFLNRSPPTKEEKARILIICGGKNTEPDYFRHFRLVTADVKVLGFGFVPKTLVEKTIELKNEAAEGSKPYDQVWCVFDSDDFQDFNDAITLAERNSVNPAWSNQAFEYWLILHFEDHQGGAMHRDDYDKRLNMYLRPFRLSYEGKGSKKITRDFFDLMQAIDPDMKHPINKPRLTRQAIAIKRAERNLKYHEFSDPKSSESSSTVFKLVEEMQKHL
jgi:hypothetical protein